MGHEFAGTLGLSPFASLPQSVLCLGEAEWPGASIAETLTPIIGRWCIDRRIYRRTTA